VNVVALAAANLVRTPVRTAVRAIVLAVAVALVGAMILFIGHSLRTMTASATRSVALDWQAPVPSYQQAVHAAAGVSRERGVLAAFPAATSSFAEAEHQKAGVGLIRSGTSAILAVPPAYFMQMHTVRFLRGSLRAGEIVFDQQLAATLQVEPGDTVAITVRRGHAPLHLRVSGIALVTAPDVLFQPLNPLLGPAPAQPPPDIAVVPLSTFARRIAPLLPTVAAATGTAAVPGAAVGTQWQVQAQVDPHALRGSPAHALQLATRIRNRVERSLPGQVTFVDNLSDSLNTASGDALYAETLYIMLALPGTIVALGLAYLAALGTVDRDRRDLSLLRARGASRRVLIALAATESALLGIIAGLIGAGIALLALRLAHVGQLPLTAGRIVAMLLTCVGLATVGAGAARLGAGFAALRGSVIAGRRTLQRATRPLWQRLYLDLVALAVSGLIYWLTARTGFSAVVNPDSNPTLSLSVYMFLAPALLWVGAALVLVRIRGRALTWLAARATSGRATTLSGLLIASVGRRGSAINRGLLLVGLLLAFGVNLGIFSATYDQQARVDAQLTLGADVVVNAPPGVVAAHSLERRVAAVGAVSGTTAVDHAYAYVGPDLQDTFGVDPATLQRGTSLRDSYFLGSSVDQILARLRAQRDAILVSRETITDYGLNVGDLLRLRVLDRRTGKLRIAPFHVAGIVQEFPSAPRDSFMVANLAYLEEVTHGNGPNVVFAKTNANPSAVARRVLAATRSTGVTVKDITTQTAQTVSSITTVDLAGITRIEELFAIVLASVAMGLFVVLGVIERRHEFATMAALGASLREIAAFLWSEAALVLVGALALAALLGWLLAQMLVVMLQHVFDPPPDHLAAPWPFLLGLGGAAIAGALVATAISARTLRRLPLGEILREQ
jgi:putative ABC transport system permease protein